MLATASCKNVDTVKVVQKIKWIYALKWIANKKIVTE